VPRRRQPAFDDHPVAAADPGELREALARRGQAFGSVRGDSMTPALLDGDITRVVPAGRPRRGQVLVLEDLRGRIITHRVVRVRDAFVVCRGDNRDGCDDAVPAAAVIGRVVEVVGGPPVVDAGVRLLALEARMLARRALHLRRRLQRVRHESRLLRAQARASAAWRGPLTDDGVAGDPPGALIVRGRDVDLDGRLAATRPAEDGLVVPAGVYCRLPPAARRALLARLAGLHVVVFAYARPTRGVLLPLLVLVRHLARWAGRDCGEPGDAVMGDGSGALVHLFGADELAAELTASLGPVAVTPVPGPLGLFRAETRPTRPEATKTAPATAR